MDQEGLQTEAEIEEIRLAFCGLLDQVMSCPRAKVEHIEIPQYVLTALAANGWSSARITSMMVYFRAKTWLGNFGLFTVGEHAYIDLTNTGVDLRSLGPDVATKEFGFPVCTAEEPRTLIRLSQLLIAIVSRKAQEDTGGAQES